MKVIKKIFSSYIISVPAFVFGVVCLMQANDNRFIVDAEQAYSANGQPFAVGTFLIVIGSIFILIAILSFVTRFLVKAKD